MNAANESIMQPAQNPTPARPARAWAQTLQVQFVAARRERVPVMVPGAFSNRIDRQRSRKPVAAGAGKMPQPSGTYAGPLPKNARGGENTLMEFSRSILKSL